MCLNTKPVDPHQALPLSGQIAEIRRANIRKLEDSTGGGTFVQIGQALAGQALDCPLPAEGPWPVVGIRDLTLAQNAYHLTHGELYSPSEPSAPPAPIPIVTVADVAGRGPYHMDIYYKKPNGDPQGPFDLIDAKESKVPEYPILWAHDAKKERRLVVAPDTEGQIKSWPRDQAWINKKATEIWGTATRAHYNRDLQFNAQSIIVAMTEQKCIGGHAWPSVILRNPDHEYAFSLWCNSTLGLLLHWWVTNKTQSGRGRTTVTGIPNIPTLDTRALSDEQHAIAKAQFERLREERLLPFDQIDEDPARAKLDYAILVEVLGLPASLLDDGGPIDLIRRKLAREPQIHGGKQSRVVFTDEGETSRKRTDRS